MTRRLRGEEGMALVMAVGMLAVLSLMAATMLAYSSSNARSSSSQRSSVTTLGLAEAGLARALSILAAASQANLPTLLPGETANLEGGSVYFLGILTGEIWDITSTSTVKNPAGGSDLQKTLKAKVEIGLDPNGNSAWNYVYSDAPSTRPCMVLPNSVEIGSPLFVRANLCIRNTAKATGALIKVGGTVETTQSGSVGVSGTNVPDTRVAGGCRNGTTGSFVTPCTSTQRVYTDYFSTNLNVTLEKPAVDFPYWYTYAKPGPSQSCTEGSFPGGFDNDTTLNRSRAAVDLMPSTAYNCKVISGPHLLGQISWTPDDGDADDYGSLVVLGTTFFDGDITLTNNAKGVYSGRGSIYASGKITMGNSKQLCGVVNCDVNTWDPEQNLVLLVSGYCNDVITSCDEADQLVEGFSIDQSSIFQGALYVVSDFYQQNTGQMQGPVIAHQLYFENQGIANKWVPLEAMTMGAPGGGRKLNVVSWAT